MPHGWLFQIPLLEKGDIIIDGGNSEYLDTNRRCALMESKGMWFIGTGTDVYVYRVRVYVRIRAHVSCMCHVCVPCIVYVSVYVCVYVCVYMYRVRDVLFVTFYVFLTMCVLCSPFLCDSPFVAMCIHHLPFTICPRRTPVTHLYFLLKPCVFTICHVYSPFAIHHFVALFLKGVSGGEEGARYGPSIMPGGHEEAWYVFCVQSCFFRDCVQSCVRVYTFSLVLLSLCTRVHQTHSHKWGSTHVTLLQITTQCHTNTC